MRSYPGIVTRVLRENSLRGAICATKTLRPLTSTRSHVAGARTDRGHLAFAQASLRAAGTGQGDAGGEHSCENLWRCWGLSAAAATAAATLGVDYNKVVLIAADDCKDR